MIEQLFGSKTRVKLLQLFYQNPNRSFYVREITRKIDEQINSVRRELANLLSVGIITSDNTNNKLYYEVDQTFEHYESLSNIFGGKPVKSATKSTRAKVEPQVTQEAEAAASDPFVDAIAKAGNIRLLVYTGQFTLDESPGVDIVIVGDVTVSAIDRAIADLEAVEKKVLRYSVFQPDEFLYRQQVNDRFVSNLVLAKKIVIIDRDNIL